MKLTLIVSTNIRYFRYKAGLTQEALGYRAKLHPDFIGRLERGQESVSIPNLEKIAKALKVEAYKLLIPNVQERKITIEITG